MTRTPIVMRFPILIPRVYTPNVLKPYGYVYITTNLVNGRKYVGQHRITTEGNYKGSGKILTLAIQKYGKENFLSEPIFWVETQKELDLMEKHFIRLTGANECEFWYNIASGGFSGMVLSGKDNPMYGVHRKHTEQEKSHMKHLMTGRKHDELTKQKQSIARKILIAKHRVSEQFGEENPFYGKTHSEQQKLEWRKTKGTPVVQLDLDGNFVSRYDSMSEPESQGFFHTYISNCCKGTQKSHKGYKWVYESQYMKGELK